MKHYFFKKLAGILVLLLISTGLSYAQGETQALIKTNFGNIKIKLYNDTPIHKANFIRLAKAGRYDGTLFFRVVKNFVIQGASSDSRTGKTSSRNPISLSFISLQGEFTRNWS